MTQSGVESSLKGRSLLEDADLTKEQYVGLLGLSERLRHEKRSATERERLRGKNIALIFEKSSTRTRSAFEVAAYDQGARVTYLGPGESQMGHKETVRDTARVLGRIYDGIEFRGYAHRDVQLLAEYSNVPVWNGLTDTWHPTQLLADMLTIRDHCTKPLEEVKLAYLGDARNNTANSLLCAGALLGLDVRMGAPTHLQPAKEIEMIARDLARSSGAAIAITTNVQEAVAAADFIYTDVWVSMGEPTESWSERIDALRPYQVNSDVMQASGNPDVRFMHCLPALHNTDTDVGAQLHEQYGLDALEVTDEVFESAASIVFDQAENRLHTIKALLVATLTGV
ncbi:MAG: ornithine carbamoyltransferase [Acidobacteria bacterium]|nr:ornithine carbamoyltransferase [Acidobacteriota bacterium]